MHCMTAAAPPSSLDSLYACSAKLLIILITAIKKAPKAKEPILVIEAHLNPSMISPEPSLPALELK